MTSTIAPPKQGIDAPAEGLHFDVPEHVYRRWPCMNYSRLKLLDESPEIFAYREKHPQEQTDALRFGTALDIRLTTPHRFKEAVAVGLDCDKRSNVNKQRWKDFEAAMEGRTIVNAAELLALEEIAKAVSEHREAHKILSGARTQVCMVWKDKETGVLLKGRLDALNDVIADLKSTRDVSEGPFSRDINEFGYYIQAALYRDGYKAATGKDAPFIIIACQNVAPHRVKCFRLGRESIACGRIAYRRALFTYQCCLKSGIWKDPDIIENISLPAWKLRAEGFEPESEF